MLYAFMPRIYGFKLKTAAVCWLDMEELTYEKKTKRSNERADNRQRKKTDPTTYQKNIIIPT